MKRTYVEYLEDILEAMQKARRFVEEMDYSEFVQDEKTNFAAVRAVEIIGEATKHIPDEIRARFPEISWQDMARMRDKIIHAYFEVDFQIVWDTVTVDIPRAAPAVRRCLEILVAEEEEGSSQ